VPGNRLPRGSKTDRILRAFLDDDDIRAISGTAGLVGLWPYRYKGHGAADLDALMRHARYIADLVGSAHLCLGTDINGVPGMLTGYKGERNVRLIAAHLESTGFSRDEVEGITDRKLYAHSLSGATPVV
jgi:microsomal dipeptidase-like Zn-dependent dipeptidase